ncbi:Hexadecenal dehydrogenase [Collariella sp. IMI 366227]|nr:Hexadecenal dehydrogenase [Collariella sp. IMI 366227]
MATTVSIPDFHATALDSIPKVASAARMTFRTHKTKSIQWRMVQLRKLYWALDDYTPQILAALKQDLRRSDFESHLIEVDWLKNDCMYTLKHLDAWAKDQKLRSPDVPAHFSMMNFRVRKEPLGTVLIIGPYNLPIQLLLAPLIGAISAGCTAVLKPSELTPACAMVIKQIIETRLDASAFAVVNGGIPETNALMNEKWDKVFFTGSAQVGTIIAKKAAETLTPVVLELGGKNPAFITKNANLALAAKRLLWGKVTNCGQVCLSQNYVLIDKDIRHFQRIKKMLDNTKGKIVMGGAMDETENFIEPTAVLVNSVDDSMMQEESFGPVFSIYPFNTLDEALNVANLIHRTPLSLFSFASKAENKRR